MKVTVHAEGTPSEIAKQLHEAAKTFGGQLVLSAGTNEEIKEPAKPAKKASKAKVQEETFDDAEATSDEDSAEWGEDTSEEGESDFDIQDDEVEEEPVKPAAKEASAKAGLSAAQLTKLMEASNNLVKKQVAKGVKTDAARARVYKVLSEFKLKSVKDCKQGQYPALLKALA